MTAFESFPDELMTRIADPASRDQLEALVLLARCHRINCSDVRWLHAEALGLIFLGQSQASIELLGQLSSPHDREADTWLLRGMAYRKLIGNSGEALMAYQRANSLEPGRADILYNIANILADNNSFLEAIKYYSNSLRLDPFNAACWFNRGLACLNAGDPQSAIRSLATGLYVDPLNDDALCNYGLALVEIGSLEPAERAFTQALTANAHNSQASTNLGNVKLSQCDPESALPLLIKGASSDSKPRLNLGLCQLLLGQFEAGWLNYESRLDGVKVPCVGPRLNSFDQVDKGRARLVVWSEQGLGDSIMFARYLLLLDARRITWCFYCPDVLVKLFKNWMNISGEILPLSSLSSACTDFQIPLLSLPRLFQTDFATIPGVVPYLHSLSEIPHSLRLAEPPGGLSVGLVWASDPTNSSMYKHKSIPLNLLMPRLFDLVELDLIDIHSLQVGSDVDQLLTWSSHKRVVDWSSRLVDFESTAYVVKQLDLVITVDTAVAHLAAALGTPTWLLLPANADFRWLCHRSDSPWYPGFMRVFRQSSPGDWQSVLCQVGEALDRLFLLNLSEIVASRAGR